MAVTTDHDEIRRWIEDRGGYPAVVADSERSPRGGEILEIDFDGPEGNGDHRLQRINWEEFFQIFEQNDLAFLRQEEGASRFHNFVAKAATKP